MSELPSGLRRVPFVACVEDQDAHHAETREAAIGAAVTQWLEDVDGDFGPGEGPDSITVTVYRGVTLCTSVDDDGDCPCGEGDAHEEKRWTVHGWEGWSNVKIPMTYNEDGDPVDLTHEALELALLGRATP